MNRRGIFGALRSVRRAYLRRVGHQQRFIERVPQHPSTDDISPQVGGHDLLCLDADSVHVRRFDESAQRDGDETVAVCESRGAFEVDDWRMWPVDHGHLGLGIIGHRIGSPQIGAALANPSGRADDTSIMSLKREDEAPDRWPGHSGFITATAILPPVAQMKRLLDRFGTSGEASPAFVEALIGELVLTRVRLAAADPRVLCSFDPVAA